MRFRAGAGSYVLKPRGKSHTFWNPSPVTTVRYIELSGRDGFEPYVDSHFEGAVKATVKAKLKLGMTTHVTRIPQLIKEHNLRGLAAVNWSSEEH